MRALIIFTLVAAVCGDKLGYNYRPVTHSEQGLSFVPGGGSSGSLAGLAGLASNTQGVVGSSASGGRVAGGPGSGVGSGGNGIGGLIGQTGDGSLTGPVPNSGSAVSAGYNKEFFSYTAPEEDYEDAQATQQIESSVKRNVRVIFIKGPENKALENAVLNLARHSADQSTAIYVLSKQTDIGDLANKFNAINSNKDNKPEVHFVKYRTEQDAVNAQHLIQSQYDSLQGSSQTHEGGVASVVNLASQATVQPTPELQAPNNFYLPASLLRRRV